LQVEPGAETLFKLARRPGTVVGRLTARRLVRSGVGWGYLFGAFVASSALSYSSFYKTQTERDHLATAFGSNKATAALFGPAPQLQTVAGFTVFKTFLTLMIIGAVWALLASTRLLRGEEESGRWEILLAGQTTRKAATAQVLAGLGAGVLALWLITALLTAIAGLSSKVHIGTGPALYFALALVASAVMFMAVGALTSQLAATRRQAAAYAAVFLGISYAVRMVADSGVGVHWLIWVSPLGWVEQLRPLTSPDPILLLPIFGFTALLAIIAVQLSGRRDLGASQFPDRAATKPRLGLLFGPIGLAMRTLETVISGWWAAIAVTAALTGRVARSAGATISGSSVQMVFSKLGSPGTGTATFLGVSFLILAVLVGFVAAGQITASRREESAGYLDHLLVRPHSRTSWLAGRVSVAVGVLVVSGLVAGVFTWLATSTQHSGVSFTTLVGSGLNIVPPAVCLLGIGALTLGACPRAASFITYGVLCWSLLIELVDGIGALSHWVLDTSLFHQMASTPAAPPNWGANGAMLGIGVTGSVLGTMAFNRRDLEGD
jgi:ABC-2 type transport system permease protein